MSKFSTVKFETTPELEKERAVYVTFKEGEIVNTYKQVQQGTKRLDCITNKYHKAAYNGVTIVVTPNQYMELCKMHKHFV